jgi:hypothetical protein
MPDEPVKPVTVEELLPAMVELASIQHDLLVAMGPASSGTDRQVPDRPASTRGSVLYDAPSSRLSSHDIGKLRSRTRDLIVWLLDRVKKAP